MKNKNIFIKIGILALAAVLCVVSGIDFKAMHTVDPIWRGNSALTEIQMLSDYSPGLKGTAADTAIYVFEGELPGSSLLILGGTHPNETAGLLNAVLYIENVKVERGTLYVIPHANNLAFSATAPLRGDMDLIPITLSDGSVRRFRNGNRHSNAIYQWPDPNYHDGKTGRVLQNDEVPEIRNLNRNYIGNADGSLTEKINHGIYTLVMTEEIDALYDAHEAFMRFPRTNYLIAHNNAMSLGSLAVMNTNIEGFPFNIDLSGATSFGLSHRSLGDNTPTLATLFETLNPSQGMLHSKVTMDLVMEGKSQPLVKLTDAGAYEGLVGLGEDGSPMQRRTGYHMVMARELANALTETFPDDPLILSGMPGFEDLQQNGVGYYLHPIQ